MYENRVPEHLYNPSSMRVYRLNVREIRGLMGIGQIAWSLLCSRAHYILEAAMKPADEDTSK